MARKVSGYSHRLTPKYPITGNKQKKNPASNAVVSSTNLLKILRKSNSVIIVAIRLAALKDQV